MNTILQWKQWEQDGSGAAPPDESLDTYYNDRNKGKGKGKGADKGKGKGKDRGGKGKGDKDAHFDGKCDHCNVYGHMKWQRRKLDAEMDAYRASKGAGGKGGGGKSNPGKGASGGKGRGGGTANNV